MATELPAATATSLIWALCQRLEFFAEHQPLQLEQLTFGQLTQTFRVKTDQGHYAVRHYADSVLPVRRQQELRCQHAAAAAGLAPAPLCLNNHQRMLVCEYLPAAEHTSAQRLELQLPAVISRLSALHQLKVQTPALDPWLYLQHLKQQLNMEWLSTDEPLYQQLLELARQLQFFPQQTGLCHMDLNPANVLWSDGKFWLIDFEYCQLADICFDLASLSWNYGFNAEVEQRLLALYVKARGWQTDAIDPDKYQLVKRLTLGFAWLWYKAEQLQNRDPRHQEAAATTRRQLLQLLSQTA
ncbi:phosphotransferase family protein [Rheinheimera sp.]|uniref:phosphotransferase family protein n=1 Tax=Rheinheimera sp. TaxID=1869214 RepID=UPI003AF5F64E